MAADNLLLARARTRSSPSEREAWLSQLDPQKGDCDPTRLRSRTTLCYGQAAASRYDAALIAFVVLNVEMAVVAVLGCSMRKQTLDIVA